MREQRKALEVKARELIMEDNLSAQAIENAAQHAAAKPVDAIVQSWREIKLVQSINTELRTALAELESKQQRSTAAPVTVIADEVSAPVTAIDQAHAKANEAETRVDELSESLEVKNKELYNAQQAILNSPRAERGVLKKKAKIIEIGIEQMRSQLETAQLALTEAQTEVRRAESLTKRNLSEAKRAEAAAKMTNAHDELTTLSPQTFPPESPTISKMELQRQKIIQTALTPPLDPTRASEKKSTPATLPGQDDSPERIHAPHLFTGEAPPEQGKNEAISHSDESIPTRHQVLSQDEATRAAISLLEGFMPSQGAAPEDLTDLAVARAEEAKRQSELDLLEQKLSVMEAAKEKARDEELAARMAEVRMLEGELARRNTDLESVLQSSHDTEFLLSAQLAETAKALRSMEKGIKDKEDICSGLERALDALKSKEAKASEEVSKLLCANTELSEANEAITAQLLASRASHDNKDKILLVFGLRRFETALQYRLKYCAQAIVQRWRCYHLQSKADTNQAKQATELANLTAKLQESTMCLEKIQKEHETELMSAVGKTKGDHSTALEELRKQQAVIHEQLRLDWEKKSTARLHNAALQSGGRSLRLTLQHLLKAYSVKVLRQWRLNLALSGIEEMNQAIAEVAATRESEHAVVIEELKKTHETGIKAMMEKAIGDQVRVLEELKAAQAKELQDQRAKWDQRVSSLALNAGVKHLRRTLKYKVRGVSSGAFDQWRSNWTASKSVHLSSMMQAIKILKFTLQYQIKSYSVAMLHQWRSNQALSKEKELRELLVKTEERTRAEGEAVVEELKKTHDAGMDAVMSKAMAIETRLLEDLKNKHASEMKEKSAHWEQKYTNTALQAGVQQLRFSLKHHMKGDTLSMIHQWRFNHATSRHAELSTEMAQVSFEQDIALKHLKAAHEAEVLRAQEASLTTQSKIIEDLQSSQVAALKDQADRLKKRQDSEKLESGVRRLKHLIQFAINGIRQSALQEWRYNFAVSKEGAQSELLRASIKAQKEDYKDFIEAMNEEHASKLGIAMEKARIEHCTALAQLQTAQSEELQKLHENWRGKTRSVIVESGMRKLRAVLHGQLKGLSQAVLHAWRRNQIVKKHAVLSKMLHDIAEEQRVEGHNFNTMLKMMKNTHDAGLTSMMERAIRDQEIQIQQLKRAQADEKNASELEWTAKRQILARSAGITQLKHALQHLTRGVASSMLNKWRQNRLTEQHSALQAAVEHAQASFSEEQERLRSVIERQRCEHDAVVTSIKDEHERALSEYYHKAVMEQKRVIQRLEIQHTNEAYDIAEEWEKKKHNVFIEAGVRILRHTLWNHLVRYNSADCLREWRYRWMLEQGRNQDMLDYLQEAKDDSEKRLAEALWNISEKEAVIAVMEGESKAQLERSAGALEAAARALEAGDMATELITTPKSSTLPVEPRLGTDAEYEQLREDFMVSAQLIQEMQDTRVNLIYRYTRLLIKVKEIIPLARTFTLLRSAWIVSLQRARGREAVAAAVRAQTAGEVSRNLRSQSRADCSASRPPRAPSSRAVQSLSVNVVSGPSEVRQESEAERFKREMDAAIGAAHDSAKETQVERDARFFQQLVESRHKAATRVMNRVMLHGLLRKAFSALATGFLEFLREQIEKEVVDQWRDLAESSNALEPGEVCV